jgi:hypothetical protein
VRNKQANEDWEGTCLALDNSRGRSRFHTALGRRWSPPVSAHRRSEPARPIRIGFLPPITGPLASPGAEMVNGFRLFWEQAGATAGAEK